MFVCEVLQEASGVMTDDVSTKTKRKRHLRQAADDASLDVHSAKSLKKTATTTDAADDSATEHQQSAAAALALLYLEQ